jgi:hypothetical protein
MSITELAGSPRESLNESSGSSAERRYLVPMNQRITFAQAQVGRLPQLSASSRGCR